MRIPLTCLKCSKEKGQPDVVVYPAVLQDTGLYWMKCRSGHETVTCLQEQKFELLFEIAANAIVDGYYREAILSFTSSLERFYEFYIQVLCAKFGVGERTFLEAWKKVTAQSERQLGAYAFLYLVDNGEPAQLLPESLTKFRNDVIHKGKIPTKEEASNYGQVVLNLISPTLTALKTKYSDHVGTLVTRHISKTRKQIEGSPYIQFMTISTTINVTRGANEPQPTLADTLLQLTHNRRRSKW